jgi:hypothetical protein
MDAQRDNLELFKFYRLWKKDDDCGAISQRFSVNTAKTDVRIRR